MKQYITLFMFLFLGLRSFGQDSYELPIDPATNKVSYSEVVSAPGISKRTLFESAKKWIATKNSSVNPYTVSFENEQDGSITGKGTFSLPGQRRNYVVQFVIKIFTKENKVKYELTDLIVQFHTSAGASSGGYGGWGSSSYHDAQTLENSLEPSTPSVSPARSLSSNGMRR